MLQTSARPVLLVMMISGTSPLQAMPLTQDVVTIGRAPENTIVLADPAISRNHLRLEHRGSTWHVTCLASSRNLFINGQARMESDLRPGDQMVIGGMALRFDVPGANQGQGLQGTIMAGGTIPLLQVRVGGSTFQVPLRESVMTLGRDPTSTIILPSPLVSAHHARIQREPDGRFTLRDVGAANGMYVRGQRVMTHTFADEDVVAIGEPQGPQSVTLTFMAPAMAGMGAHASVAAPPRISAPQPGMRGDVTIGRDPASTFCLPNPLVSWHHAVLSRDPTGSVVLRDLGSTNGTFVNFQRITIPAALRTGDKVHIGIYDFIFDGAQLTQERPLGQGMRIDVYDLVRTVKGGKTVLLDHVTLTVQPGDFIAIAGGSGAGKTTLMRALAGIQPAQHGKVFFNGIDAYQNYNVFRGTIGYVPQADIVHGALTVERALYYTARFRLASDVRPDEIEQRIRSVLETVGLAHRRYNVINSLSGGERKRVNLAVELLADPPILFLDEPNAGLDPNLRMELIQTMRDLAAKGRTIVLVTHHIEDIQACDRLAFMGAGGRLCYYGPPKEALAFFQVPTFEHLYGKCDNPQKSQQWRGYFQQSPVFAQYVRSALPQQPQPQAFGPAQMGRQGWGQSSGNRLSATGQWLLLMQRYTEILFRDRINLLILLIQAPIIGIILFAFGKANTFSGTNANFFLAQRILLFMAVAAIWFGTSNSAREISKEIEIYQRERLAGLGVVPYIFSKVGVLAGLGVVQTCALELFVLVKTGASPPETALFFGPVLELYISLLLASLAGMAMGLCVSAAANTPDKALSIVPIVLIPQVLLAGIIFPLSGPIQAFGDITISHWVIQSMGTSVNLDHVYYQGYLRGNPALVSQPDQIDNSVQNSLKTGSNFFDPSYYGVPSSTLTTDYLQGVQDSLTQDNNWDDAQGERRAHLTVTWFALIVLFGVFTGGAVWLQRAKDPK